MVSKARLDLPDPDSPVMTISASRGSSRDMSLRLCSRAPEMRILSSAATYPLYGGVGTTRPGPCWTVEMVARAQYVFARKIPTFERGGDNGCDRRHHGVRAGGLAARGL